MTTTRIALAVAVVAITALAVPAVSHGAGVSFPYWGPLLSCVGSASSTPAGAPSGSVTKTCSSFCDILETAQHIIYFGITLVFFAFTPIFILWGGILILISGGSTERRGQGRKIITGTVIGLAITLGAFLIVNTFLWGLGLLNANGEFVVKNAQGQAVFTAWPTIECAPPPMPSSNGGPAVVPQG